MRGPHVKTLFFFMIVLLFLGSLLTTLTLNDNHVEPQRPIPQVKFALPPGPYKGLIEKVKQRYAQTWKKQDDNWEKFIAQLSSQCHGSDKAIITQANTPVGSKLVYDGDKKKSIQVNAELFRTFIKEHPFPNKTWDTCSVVGNGGILTNSSCGESIDSAEFVIRCNLPPLKNGYEKHVGVKTDIVTANPSIFVEKYGSLMGRRRPFADSVQDYGNSVLLLPAFSYAYNTPISLRVFYTLEDFRSSARPVFFNPEYLKNLDAFWRSKGLKATRLTTGIMMTSLALEMCANVHLYGFWPFSNHLHDFRELTNHYYDDKKPKTRFHAMPSEFELLLQLHSQGVLRIHLGHCKPYKM
ncbi:alpha-2,8-sialyltransferase 8F [Echeneis naucrates]|uniref:Alpha-2,8-sialyltransferase 8F-like n=1 Tax=Echeneis naucrates TaxID=173247 RepID=A0A665UJ28_ECHNA|nr:alpha-2,8-sialyltransferase 8F-like [Echeneis naucrates]